MVVVVFVLVCRKPSHTCMFSTYYSCYIVKGHVEKVMAIVLLCESAQQFRALMIVLQYHEILSMISMMVSQCPISSASETSQDLPSVLFRQSLYSPFKFIEFFIYFLYYVVPCGDKLFPIRTVSLPRNTVQQASEVEKKPEAFYWKLLQPLNLPCGSRSACMHIDNM